MLTLICWHGWGTAEEENEGERLLIEDKLLEFYMYNTGYQKQDETSAESITMAQRESAYVEGERAFNVGQWRTSNPYSTSGSTLEQVWWNGWDHGRRREKLEGSRQVIGRL
jgi:outer membrane usher protein FimD/PapC